MPNQPDPDKIMLSVRVPRTLYEQLSKLYKSKNKIISEIVIDLISLEVSNISLTAEDYENIAEQVRKALRRYQNC